MWLLLFLLLLLLFLLLLLLLLLLLGCLLLLCGHPSAITSSTRHSLQSDGSLRLLTLLLHAHGLASCSVATVHLLQVCRSGLHLFLVVTPFIHCRALPPLLPRCRCPITTTLPPCQVTTRCCLQLHCRLLLLVRFCSIRAAALALPHSALHCGSGAVLVLLHGTAHGAALLLHGGRAHGFSCQLALVACLCLARAAASGSCSTCTAATRATCGSPRLPAAIASARRRG